MAGDATAKVINLHRPAPNWIALEYGPFFFRRRNAGFFDFAPIAGSSLGEILNVAAARHPLATVREPSPILFEMNEGEGCLWVTWSWALPDATYVDAIRYKPDSLEAPSDVAKQVKGLHAIEAHGGEVDQALGRMAEVWTLLKDQFALALQARAVRLMARKGDPSAPFDEVAYDTFRNYRVSSWKFGNAVSDAGHGANLYSIYIDPLSEPVPARPPPGRIIGPKPLEVGARPVETYFELIEGAGLAAANSSTEQQSSQAQAPSPPLDAEGGSSGKALAYEMAILGRFPEGIDTTQMAAKDVDAEIEAYMKQNALRRSDRADAHSRQVREARKRLAKKFGSKYWSS